MTVAAPQDHGHAGNAQFAGIRQAINAGRMTPFQIRTVLLCALLNLMDGYDIMALVYTASAISSDWQLSATELGLLLSAGLVGMAVGSVLITPLADRFGRKHITVVSLLVITAGMLCSAWAPQFTTMAAGRVVTGIGVGGLIPSLSVIASEFASDKWRSGAISFMGVGYTLGAVLGGLAAGELLASQGWRSVFLLGACGTAALVVLVCLWLPESVEFLALRQPVHALARLNRTLQAMGMSALDHLQGRTMAHSVGAGAVRTLWAPSTRAATFKLWSAAFLILMASYFVITWTPRLLVLAGLSPAQAIVGGVLLNAGGVLGTLLFGWLASRAHFGAVTLVFLAMALACLVLFSAFSTHLKLAFALTVAIGLFMFGAIAGVNTLAPSVYPSAVRATGLATGMGRLGAIVSPALTGWLVDAGHQIGWLYLYYCLPLLLALALMWSLRSLPSQFAAR